MGNSIEIKEKTTLLNIILFGKIPINFISDIKKSHENKTFIPVIEKIMDEVAEKKKKIINCIQIEEGNIKYNIKTINAPGYLHYDYLYLFNNTIDDLKTLIKLKKKVVILYFHHASDGNDYDKRLITNLSKLEQKYHPFIIFLTLETRNKEYYENLINDSNIKFDPLNIYSIKNEYDEVLERNQTLLKK